MLAILINLEANYCIQVITTDTSKKNFIIQKASSEEYSSFSDVRVEKRGNYLVLRIGDYKDYKYASSVAKKVKRISSDAYVRTCDFIRSSAVYLHNDSQDSDYYRDNQSVTNYTTSSPAYVKPKKVQKAEKEYTKKEELSYRHIERDNSLWNDCKKCFIPVYEEEDGDIKEQQQPKHKRNKEKQVEAKKDTFWEEDVPDLSKYKQKEEQKQKTERKTKNTKPRNKFNIDERFLP